MSLRSNARTAHRERVGALFSRVRFLAIGETGAATTAILIGGMVIVLSLVFMFALPLTRGADQASRSQNAADAAALAGGKQVREVVLDSLAAGDLTVLAGLGASIGSSEASVYANRNDSTLAQYSYDAFSDEVRTKIRLDSAGVEGSPRVERVAVVELGVPLGRCRITSEEIEPEPVPTPTETETEDDEEDLEPPPPPPPPEFEYAVNCPGGVSLSGFDNQRDLARAAHLRLENLLEVRLIR